MRVASPVCYVFLVAVGPLLAASPSEAEDAPASRPNVLMIVVDDMRAELGCYGDAHIVSPNLDALAARGTLFERAYCQQAVCNPSRASTLTGLYPSTLGIWDLPTHFRQRRKDIVTLPQAFTNSGYVTRGIGKVFHNWTQDRYRGDARSWSLPQALHYANHGDDVPHVGLIPPSRIEMPKVTIHDVPDEAYLDGRVAALGVDSLEAFAQTGEPFFLACGFWKPHSPFNAPAQYWNLYDFDDITDPDPAKRPKDVPGIAMHDSREIRRGFRDRPGNRPTAEEARRLRHGYYAAISFADAQIGKLLDALDRTGLAENTIVVFWSDHGYHLGEKTLWAKTSNFELDARVPMIVALPDALRGSAAGSGGQRTDALVELVDLYPTLCDLAAIDPPHELDGDSLAPLLRGKANAAQSDDDAAAFTWHPRPAYPVEGTDPKAIGWSMRTDRYRLTEWRAFDDGELRAVELYDHDADADEMANIAAERPEVVERLRPRLDAWRQTAHLPSVNDDRDE